MSKEYKQLSCRDAGVDCDFMVRTESADEALDITAGHAKRVHGYKDIPPEMAATIRGLVKTVQV
jgi:predicted small metal-binding protein